MKRHPSDLQPSLDFGSESQPASVCAFVAPTDVGPSDSFFFAVRPTAVAAAQIDDLSRALSLRSGLKGGRRNEISELHASLHALDRRAGTLLDVLDAGCRAAAAAVRPSAFPVCFDTLVQFREGPVVLCGGEGVQALADLHRSLGLALRSAGLAVSLRSTQHVTLIYPPTPAPIELPAVAPVSWTVDHFVLLHSRYGFREHRELARWQLAS